MDESSSKNYSLIIRLDVQIRISIRAAIHLSSFRSGWAKGMLDFNEPNLKQHGELLVKAAVVCHYLNSLWVCHCSLIVDFIYKAGKRNDFLLWIIKENIIHSRMISTNFLDSLVVVFDSGNLGVVLHTKLLLHKSLVEEPFWTTEQCFKTPEILTHCNLAGADWEGRSNQINKYLLMVVSMHSVRIHKSNPAPREKSLKEGVTSNTLPNPVLRLYLSTVFFLQVEE